MVNNNDYKTTHQPENNEEEYLDPNSLNRWLDDGGGGAFDKELFKKFKKEAQAKRATFKQVNNPKKGDGQRSLQ